MITREEKIAVCGLVPFADQLTDAQIDLAYEGYQRRMMDLGNLITVAVRKAFDGESEPFIYEKGNSRKETLERFNIKED